MTWFLHNHRHHHHLHHHHHHHRDNDDSLNRKRIWHLCASAGVKPWIEGENISMGRYRGGHLKHDDHHHNHHDDHHHNHHDDHHQYCHGCI